MITGASSGIGEATARRIAREPGSSLVLVAGRLDLLVSNAGAAWRARFARMGLVRRALRGSAAAVMTTTTGADRADRAEQATPLRGG